MRGGGEQTPSMENRKMFKAAQDRRARTTGGSGLLIIKEAGYGSEAASWVEDQMHHQIGRAPATPHLQPWNSGSRIWAPGNLGLSPHVRFVHNVG